MEELSFEEKLDRVKNIIDQIESGKMSLEDSVKKYEAGMKTLNDLDEELKIMNRRITILRDGHEVPFGEEVAVESNEG